MQKRPLNLFKLLSIFILTFLSYHLNAKVVIDKDDIEEISLNSSLSFLDKDIESIPKSGWTPFQAETVLQNHSNFWVKIDLQSNLQTPRDYILYLHDLQKVEVFITDSLSNIIQTYKTGTLLPLKDRSLPNGVIINGIGNSIQVPMQIIPNHSTIYLRISNIIESVFRPEIKLYHPSYWESTIIPSRQKHLFIQGAIGGAMILIGLYHLLIFFWRGDLPFLLYSIYTIFTALILWHETGITQSLFFPDYQFGQRILQMTQIFGLIATTLYFLFQRSFINLKDLLPRVDKFVLYVLLGLGIYGFVFFFAFYQQLTLQIHRLGYVSTIISMIVGLGTLILIFRTGDPLAKFFTVGSAALFAGVFFNTFLSYAVESGWLSSMPFPGIYLSETGILIEVIVFALGLGYRQNSIEKEKQRIENLDHLKTKFFTNISHEFRTPLTIISGISDQIVGHTTEKELIQRNSKNLLGLVNQLLDLSNLDAKSMPVKMVQADMISYLKYLTESFYSMANDKGIRLMFYPEVPSQMMDFDEDKIQKIIYNLLINAIKYTHANGKVILHVNKIEKNTASFLQIKVQDTGEGMSKEELENIFDRFYRAASSPSETVEGTGIGLALTKELVNLLNGTINVESEKGIGSTFTVNLPIVQQAELGIVETNFTPIYFDTKPTNEPPSELDGQVILLVEDNPDIITYLQGILSNKYKIETASNGQEGIKKAKEIVPDIIISDVMMPILDGNEMCIQLKADDTTGHIPIILLTAKSTQDDRITGLSRGADVYLTKPFNKKELLLQIENLLASRLKIQSHYRSVVSQESKDRSKKELDPVMTKIIDLIESRIDDSTLTVNEISAKIRLSRTQINRKMKALTGVSTSAFITNMRMEKAKSLLENQTLNIAEVGYNVGYSDPNYFTRVFTKHFGYPPSTLRS